MPITRRDFIKGVVGASAAITITGDLVAKEKIAAFDAKGLPTRILGKTGERVPIMAIGTGSRFCSVKVEDQALEILTYALDHGLYYWDTAHDYTYGEIASESRLGKILKDRRKEVFLSTKVGARDPDEAKRHIEESLKRLQTDYLDILKIHLIRSMEDVEVIGKKGGLVDILHRLCEEGVARHIGFTGHLSAAAMKAAAERYDFETMLIALNHYSKGQEKFEEHAVPYAAQKGMGVIVMKVIRPRETVKNLRVEDLIRYALSLEHVNAAVIGTDSLEVLKQNIDLIKNFQPMTEQEMIRIRTALTPFYRHERLEWMHERYRDGYWV